LIFNSIIFLFFFCCVYLFYWYVFKKHRLWVLLLSGCIFYGSWDWRFLLLLFFTSGIDFLSGKKIETTDNQKHKKQWLFVSVIINLVTLGFFKYFNFFADSFEALLIYFGFHPSFITLKIILPVGVSFYTFQSIAYVVDIYNNRIKSEKTALHYFAFICFFPQMVAGPIERAKKLLPQFKKEKLQNNNYLDAGLNLILYGFFKKIVIADNLAVFVDKLHNNPQDYNSIILLLGIFAFAIQIYTDFSGYTDIARGCALLLGFKLSKNFYFPYFSSSLNQFWKRWHISLSTWFRDYVYIPLGGNKGSAIKRNFNFLITFIISGLWHGANFTFMLWGFFHGFAYILEKNLPKIKVHKLFRVCFVFLVIAVLFTLFRANSLNSFIKYFSFLFHPNGSNNQIVNCTFTGSHYFIIPFLFFIAIEIIKYTKKGLTPCRFNIFINTSIIVLILLFSVFENAPRFIYFQF